MVIHKLTVPAKDRMEMENSICGPAGSSISAALVGGVETAIDRYHNKLLLILFNFLGQTHFPDVLRETTTLTQKCQWNICPDQWPYPPRRVKDRTTITHLGRHTLMHTLQNLVQYKFPNGKLSFSHSGKLVCFSRIFCLTNFRRLRIFSRGLMVVGSVNGISW